MALISAAAPGRDDRLRTIRKAWRVRAREGAERGAGVTVDLASLSMTLNLPVARSGQTGNYELGEKAKVDPVDCSRRSRSRLTMAFAWPPNSILTSFAAWNLKAFREMSLTR